MNETRTSPRTAATIEPASESAAPEVSAAEVSPAEVAAAAGAPATRPPEAGPSAGQPAEPLSRQAGVVILARGLGFIFSFFVPIVLVRTIAQESYGVYREAVFIFSLAIPILQLGLTQSLYYFFPRRPAERGSLVTQTILVLAAAGLLFAALLVLARHAVALALGQPALADYSHWIGLYTALMVVSSTVEVLTVVEQRVRLTFWVIMGSEALRALLLVGVAVLTRDVGMMLAALTVFSAARTLFLLAHCRSEGLLGQGVSVRRDFLREQLAYALPFGLAATVVTVLALVDQFYVIRYFDSRAFAIYSVGCLQLPVVAIVLQSATSVILGRMAELQKEGRFAEMLDLWRSAVRKMALVAIPMTVVFAVFAREFVVGFYTAEYEGATPIFLAFLLLIPRQAIPYGVVTRAFGLTRYIMWVCLVALGIAVALTLLLIRPLGLLGPALAVIAGQWIVADAQVARTKQLLGAGWTTIFPWQDLGRNAALAIALALVLALARRFVDGPPLVIWAVGSAIYLAAFVVLAARLGIVRQEEIEEALHLVRRLGVRR